MAEDDGVVLIRRILVAVTALSVAVLPAIAEAIVSPPTEITMADQADMPCCTCCNTQGGLEATACVLKCMTVAGAVLPAITIGLPYIADKSPRTLVDDTLHGLAKPPPTHPPPA